MGQNPDGQTRLKKPQVAVAEERAPLEKLPQLLCSTVPQGQWRLRGNSLTADTRRSNRRCCPGIHEQVPDLTGEIEAEASVLYVTDDT